MKTIAKTLGLKDNATEAQINAKAKEVTANLADVTKKLNNAGGKITKLTQERDAAKSELETSKGEVTKLTQERDTAKSELETSKSEVTKLTEERDTAKGEIATLETKVADMENEAQEKKSADAKLSKVEMAEKVADVFDRNPSMEVVYMVTDGTPFFGKAEADAHARKDNLKVTEVKRPTNLK